MILTALRPFLFSNLGGLMIYTSCHKNFQTINYKTYAISGNHGCDADYHGFWYPTLAPKKDFWLVWHRNIGVVPEEVNNRYYIEEYYKQVLSKLDPEIMYEDLKNSVLLCYEEAPLFCHRHIVAAWLELTLGISVPEVALVDNKIIFLEHPSYIKKELIQVMKNDKGLCKRLIK